MATQTTVATDRTQPRVRMTLCPHEQGDVDLCLSIRDTLRARGLDPARRRLRLLLRLFEERLRVAMARQ